MKNRIFSIIALSLFVCAIGFGQSDVLKKNIDREIDFIQKVLAYDNSGLKLNPNQVAKLEKVLRSKHQEILNLRKSDITKAAMSQGFKDIEASYKNDIEGILTKEQRVAYRLNQDEQIRRLSDHHIE